MSRAVDLNCDAGESFGAYRIGDDEALLRVVTSVNVACGFHAGDASVMRRSAALAAEHGVALGAHPGLPDLQGFGRRTLAIDAQEAYDIVAYQIGALLGVARAAGAALRHVKPHGALYNMAARDAALADAIARAVRDVDPALVLFGLSGSELLRAAERAGIRGVSEVFADRGYLPDGSLAPRGSEGAVIADPGTAAARALRMVRDGVIDAIGGEEVRVHAETVCIHGDGAGAAAVARRVRERLEADGFVLSPPAPGDDA